MILMVNFKLSCSQRVMQLFNHLKQDEEVGEDSDLTEEETLCAGVNQEEGIATKSMR